MTADTKAAPGQKFTQTLNPAAENVVDFPAIPHRGRYSTADLRWLISGGVKRIDGKDTLRSARKPESVRLFLTGAHARGEIDDEQLKLFWPGGGK